MRILVVEDDAPSRYLLDSVLGARGHTIMTAEDGEEALAAARQSPPDLIISDILMPRMDGYRLCIEWHSDARLAGIPFVFYSATYVEDADESFALSLGADAFLRKPMETHELIHTLESIRRRRAAHKIRRETDVSDDVGVLREYNERLVSKLEKKVAELHASNAALRVALELLTDEVAVKDTLIRRLSDQLNGYSK